MKTTPKTALAASIGLLLGSAYAQESHERIGPEHSSQEQQREDTADNAARRQELEQMADHTVQLLQQSDDVAVDIESAHGYAVFDTTKGGLVATGAGGTGVAVDNSTGEETYMHLGAAGVGLGAGLENYKLVMVFEDETAYQQFIDGQWSGGISGQAAAGEAGASAEAQGLSGVEVYRIDDQGLIAQADIAGMRFWPSEELNEEA
jgi:lipid-binding SYLF domain-containing protein